MTPKFRAWIKDEKKILPVWQMWFPKNDEPRAMVKSQKTGKFLINAFPLMQSTGLKDKNGKEIYEGDIAKVYRWEVDDGGCHHEQNTFVEQVCYSKGTFYFGKPGQGPFIWEFLAGREPEDIEIIGNIYENPELLEEGK